MASTANYGWIKPDVGASDDIWGGQLNADLDGIDATVKGIDTAVSGKLNLTGGTVTGPAAFTAGISLGSSVSSGVNLSKGLAIYSTTFGFSVNAPGTMAMIAAGVQVATLNSNGFNNTAIGATTPSTGAFTNLAASGTVSGAGFTSLLAPYALTASVPVASSSLPLINGTAAAGTGATFARADHVHPTDTSRAAASDLAGYLPLAGGTLTGPLNGTAATFSGNLTAPYGYFTSGYLAVKTASSGNTAIDLAKSGSGQTNVINGYSGSTSATALRWQMALGDTAAESGGSAGSNFALSRFGDTGAYIDTPFSINRASGAATFGGSGASAFSIANPSGDADVSQLSGRQRQRHLWAEGRGESLADAVGDRRAGKREQRWLRFWPLPLQ